MRINESVLLSTRRLYLVPYCDHHVEKYHAWMGDPALREATSSEPLSLEEEYEAQKQWMELTDRLTFILLDRTILDGISRQCLSETYRQMLDWKSMEIAAMLGDINLFLTPQDDVDLTNEKGEHSLFEGELSVMLAEESARGRGLAAEALAAFLEFIARHLPYRLTSLVAKVSLDNVPSIRLFQGRLGFTERSRCNVFKQVDLVPPAQELLSHEAKRAAGSATSKSNIAGATSRWIIARMSHTHVEFTQSMWSYEERDLCLWREGLTNR